jgi:molybdopterin converting factor small subunit
MRVRVYAPPFADHSVIDGEGRVELPGGATLGDLLKLLKVPFRGATVALFTVNWARAGLATRLAEGDTIGFIPLIAGG